MKVNMKISATTIGVISFVVFFSIAVFASYAKPGEGIKWGNLTLSPFVNISTLWDSNVRYTASNEKDDFFMEIVPGIALANKTEKLSLSLRGWGQFRRYLDVTDLDSDSYGQKLGVVWGAGDRLTLTVNENYAHYETEQRSVDTVDLASQNLMLTEDRTESVNRDLFGISPVLGYEISDKMQADVGYSYSSVNYKLNFFDWYENRGQIELRQKVTDKTSALVNGQYSEQNSDGYANDSTYYILRGGFLYEATMKMAFKGSAGYGSYDFGNKSLQGEDLNKDFFSFDLATTWRATDKILVEAIARNSMQPAAQYEANTKEISLASLGASYDITESWILSLAGSWRYDDYIGKVQDLDNQYRYKNRTIYSGRLRLDYKPRIKFFDVYTEMTYENSDANIQDDFENYDQWRITLGLALRY